MGESYPYLEFARANDVDYGKVLSFVDALRNRNTDSCQIWQTDAVNEFMTKAIVGLKLLRLAVFRHPETLGKCSAADYQEALSTAIAIVESGEHDPARAIRMLEFLHAE